MRNGFTSSLVAAVVAEDKIKMSAMASEIMPAGAPDFSIIPYCPTINQLKKSRGHEQVMTVLMLLISDFNNSVNVPEGKKMTDAQIVEAASFLLDEAGNYRLEDYFFMFTLAKRNRLYDGKKGRIFDRVDLPLISDFKDSYEALRRQGEESIREDELRQKEMSIKFDERDNPNEPEEMKKQRFDMAMEMFKKMIETGKAEREIKIKEDREVLKKKQSEYVEKIKKWAEDRGMYNIAHHIEANKSVIPGNIENLINLNTDK